MKLKQIYLLNALLWGHSAKLSGTEVSNLLEGDNWKRVASQIGTLEPLLSEKSNQNVSSIASMDHLTSTYIHTMKPQVQEWRENDDPRFLEALTSLTSVGILRKKLMPSLDEIFNNYLKTKQFAQAYAMSENFCKFREQAHNLFKGNEFSRAIEKLSILLNLHEVAPHSDAGGQVLKAQDRFYLMTAYMKVGLYKKAEGLSDGVLGFITYQPNMALNHLQLSICAVNAFAVNNHDKSMQIINDKVDRGDLFDEDYLIMSCLYEKMTGSHNSTWKAKIDEFDQVKMESLLQDTAWLREIVTHADFIQKSEPLLPKPSNPIQKLIRDTFDLEKKIGCSFQVCDYDSVVLFL